MRRRDRKRSADAGVLFADLRRAAEDMEWPLGPARLALLRIIARRLTRVSHAAVAVVADGRSRRVAEVLRAAIPDCRVTELARREGLRDVHVRLAATGPYDLILDLTGKGSPRRFMLLLLHARRGGALVTRLPSTRGPLNDLLEDVQRLRAAGPPSPPQAAVAGPDFRTVAERNFAALVNSFEGLVLRRHHAVAVNAVTTRPVVREEMMTHYLELRAGPDRTIATVPASPWTSRATVRASQPAWLARLPPEHSPLDVSLRLHHNVVCGPRQTAVQDIVLPASYRHFRKQRLFNRSLVSWTPRFVLAPDSNVPTLAGRWFFLDNEFRGHFGHAMTEQISQLWGWSEAKQRYPDLRALVFRNRGRAIAEWEFELLAAGGIGREDLVMAERPVRVEALLTATPMFSMPKQLHPEIAVTWAGIGEALAARASRRDYPERVFCTRRPPKRACRNAAEVEEYFKSRGFEIVLPEEHPLADQVQFFRQASVIAGFAGSGMFQLALTGGPRHAILVSSDSYTAQNEYMISSVLGHRHDVALCRAAIPQPEGRWTAAAYTSEYTFDRAREGVFLDEIMADLE